MKKVLEKLDPKYVKICSYAAITVLVTFGAIQILKYSGSFWAKLWEIFSAVMKPVIIGGVISYLFLPIVNRVQNLVDKNNEHKWSRILGIIVTFLLVVAALGIIIALIILTVYKNVEAINLESLKNLIVDVQKDNEDLVNFVMDKLGISNMPSGKNVGSTVGSTVVNVASAIKEFFSGLLFGIIFSIYFMAEGNRIAKYWTRALRLIFGKKSEDALMDFMADADHAFSGYIRGQFTDALIVGVLSTIALIVAGVPNAGLIGLFVGVGNLIPYFGPVVGYLTLFIACLPSANFSKLIVGAIVLAVVMFIDGNVINPKLLGDAVAVHPLLVVAALIGGGALGGLVGMIVAVPVAALIKLQFDRYLDKCEASGGGNGKR